MSFLAVAAGFPVTALVIWALIRSPLAARVSAEPRSDRWHERPTPMVGGIGIFAGLAAGIVVASGVTISGLISNDVLAGAVALLWLVGMTNAFNLLDNMDGLAATLAAIAAAFFMGDSGSQVLGFALAALGLTASWKVAGTTVATLLLPILVLAVPILDTTLVTIVRLLDGRPVYRGGRDHTSHRLVYHGLSEKRAVALLAVVSIALGTTSLAYEVLGNQWITLIGVLLTFALLVQFGSLLSEVERATDGARARDRSVLRAFVTNPRRLVESLADFALITASFAAAYYIRLQDSGTPWQRHIFLISLPVILFARYA